MSKAHDPYLQAAEGFLHTIRHEIDMADPDMDQTLKITQVYALVSIARSLNELGGREESTNPAVALARHLD